MTDLMTLSLHRSFALQTEMGRSQRKTIAQKDSVIAHKDSVIAALKIQIKMMRQASEEHFAGHDCAIRDK